MPPKIFKAARGAVTRARVITGTAVAGAAAVAAASVAATGTPTTVPPPLEPSVTTFEGAAADASHGHDHGPGAPSTAPLPRPALGPVFTQDLPGYGRDVFRWGVDKVAGIFRESPQVRDVAVDPARLEQDVRSIVTDFFPRDITHSENLDRLAGHIAQSFEASGGRVEMQEYTLDVAALKRETDAKGHVFPPDQEEMLRQADGKTFRNVIASFGPEDGERVVIGAHYDSFQQLPGADDNASGVAGLMELARQLGQEMPGKRVDLVAFTNEERPLGLTSFMGSMVHAQSLKDQGVEVKAMLALEMIGYFTDEPNSQTFPAAAPAMGAIYGTEGDFIATVGFAGDAWLHRLVDHAMQRGSAMESHYLTAPSLLGDAVRSDHSSYARVLGIPAAMVTDTANMRNPGYHGGGDTPETLDYVRMAEVMKGVTNAVYWLAS